MLTLKKIYIKNFLAFSGEHELVFPEHGLVSLKGCCNNNTASSNGAGKSSLLEAIAYAFDYCDSPATELKNWSSEEDFKVVLWFEVDGQEYVITRGSGLYEVRDGLVVYKSAQTKDFLKRLINTPELISFMTYRPQGVFGNFLSLNNTDKSEFLSGLLDFSQLEKILTEAQSRLKDINKTIDEKKMLAEYYERENKVLFDCKEELKNKSVMYSLENVQLQKTIEELSQIDVGLVDPVLFKSMTKNLLIEKNKLIDEYQNKKEKLKITQENSSNEFLHQLKMNEEQTKELEEIFKNKNSNIEEIKQAITSIVKEIEIISSVVNQLQKNIDTIEKEKAQVPELLNKFQSLTGNICYTCNQQWVANTELLNQIKDKIRDIQKKDKVYLEQLINEKKNKDKSLLELREKQKRFEFLLNVHLKIKEFKNNREKLFSEFEIKKGNLERQVLELESFHQRKLKDIDHMIANVSIELQHKKELEKQELDNKIAHYKSKLERNNKIIQDLNSQISSVLSKTKANELLFVQNELCKLGKQNIFEMEVINCLGKDNFFSLIFEELLQGISMMANVFLKNIPNASSFRIEFETEKVTQKGNVKRGITLKIFQKGQERPFKMLSGGERCAINLAIDVAIGQILSQRSGKSFGWMIYDEPFDAMDIHSKMESLDFLKKIAQDKLIILVEHTNDLNEAFDKIITVIKNNGKSEIVTNF